MKWCIKNHPLFGEALFADNGVVEIGIPLGYGLRIGHFSLCGGENLFYEQPVDMTDLTTPDGWRVRGGHRLWIAPESPRHYYPDNNPIFYEVENDEIKIWQEEDPWLCIEKSISIIFEEGAKVRVINRVKNTGSEKRICSVWGVTVLAPGGTEKLTFDLRDGGYDHWKRVTMWDYTSLGDTRAEYRRDGITLRHQPTGQKYKIGVGHPTGVITYENKGVVFEKNYTVRRDKPYPDGDVSFETFMCDYMLEMETLSPLGEMLPGETLEHEEIWKIQTKN